MEGLEIIQEKNNPLFKRKEFKLNIKSDSSPKNLELKELIAKKFSIAKENIKIKNIKGKFGSKNFVVETNIYESEETKNLIEPDKKTKTSTEEKVTEEQQTQVEKSEEKQNA